MKRLLMVAITAGATLVPVLPAAAAPAPGFRSNAVVRLTPTALTIRVPFCPVDPPSSFTAFVDQDGDGTDEARGLLPVSCEGSARRFVIPLVGTLEQGRAAEVELHFNGDSGEWNASFQDVRVR